MAGGDLGIPVAVGDSQGVLGDDASSRLGEDPCGLMKRVRAYAAGGLDCLIDGAKLTIGRQL